MRAARRLPHTLRGRNPSAFPDIAGGRGLARTTGVTWFFERNSEMIVCEIRRAADNDGAFEFEIAGTAGPRTARFESPRELIATYLREQSRLLAEGWLPRNVATLG
jgi:hypothetical protein